VGICAEGGGVLTSPRSLRGSFAARSGNSAVLRHSRSRRSSRQAWQPSVPRVSAPSRRLAFRTISAQSAGDRSSVHLSLRVGTKSFATMNRSAAEDDAGVPLFMPARKWTFPGLIGSVPFNRQCAAVSTIRGATSVPVHKPPVLKCATATTPIAEAGQVEAALLRVRGDCPLAVERCAPVRRHRFLPAALQTAHSQIRKCRKGRPRPGWLGHIHSFKLPVAFACFFA
jgi:hypothetical protein